jgi:serine/threonine protein kinase/Flp pilus assembly protein TadD
MSHHVPTGDAAEVLMGQLVDEFLERLDRREEPDVEEYCGRYPELAGVLRQMLPALAVLGRSAGAGEASASGRLGEPLEPEGLLGDYRMVREIGRGGMGIVYEAVQVSLGRHVALKVLPFAATLDPRQLQRFKNEAHAAAQLHHSNIVPVYGVGHERGVHYYAMQYIDGQTLAATIACLRQATGQDRPGNSSRPSLSEVGSPGPATAPYTPAPPVAGDDSPVIVSHADPVGQASSLPAAALSTERSNKSPGYFRSVARLGVQAAEALEHAHQMGVIHRDIKPANLLVDVRGNLWVTDFGLAQVHTDTRLTLTGDLVGTLRYMSPEQALARRVDIDLRTDIYSLGATLCELLTLEPVFAGRDRQELLRQIAFEEPKSPRRWNRAIPRELEIIVLKALAKNPEERYGTAQELADDLERFLKDEPIKARRPTLTNRLRKWARRHRAAVLTATIAFVLSALALAGLAGWMLRERAEQERRVEEERLERERRVADERKERERRAAIEIERSVKDARTLLAARRWPEGLALAEHAQDILDRVEGQEALRPLVADALRDLHMVRRLEDITLSKADTFQQKSLQIGFERPGESYRPAFQQYGIDVLVLDTHVAAEMIRKRHIVDYLVEALDDWARMETDQQTRQRLHAVVQAAQPQGILAQWRAADPGDLQAMRSILATVKIDAVPPGTLAYLGRSAGQRGMMKEGVEILRAAYREHPDDFWINADLAYACTVLKPPLWEEALRHYAAALALRPRNARLYLNISQVLFKKGEYDAGVVACRKAIALQPDFAFAHNNLGALFLHLNKLAEAEAETRLAIKFQPAWAYPYNNLGRILAEHPLRYQEAFEAFNKALALNDRLANAYSGRGRLWVKLGEFDKAIADFHKAIDCDAEFIEAHYSLGSALIGKKLFDQALKSYETALGLDPKRLSLHLDVGLVYADWARHQVSQGKPASAYDMLDKAIAKFKETIALKHDYPEAWYVLGNALRDRGQMKAALAAFDKAIEFKPKYVDAYYNRGNMLRRSGQYDSAIASYHAALKADGDHLGACMNLSATLIDLGKFAESERVLRDAQARKKDDANLTFNIAVALDRQGRFDEAVEVLEQGLKKLPAEGKDRKDFEKLSALYRQFRDLHQRLPAFLSGKEKPASAEQRLLLAKVCLNTHHYGAAVRFFQEAFAAQPASANDLGKGYRFDAARAAACAGCGLGKDHLSADSGTPDRTRGTDPKAAQAEQQARWRQQALEWLQADLKLWSQRYNKEGAGAAPAVIQALQRWRHHLQFAGVRGVALDTLPRGERVEWGQFWADVDALLQRIAIP